MASTKGVACGRNATRRARKCKTGALAPRWATPPHAVSRAGASCRSRSAGYDRAGLSGFSFALFSGAFFSTFGFTVGVIG